MSSHSNSFGSCGNNSRAESYVVAEVNAKNGTQVRNETISQSNCFSQGFTGFGNNSRSETPVIIDEKVEQVEHVCNQSNGDINRVAVEAKTAEVTKVRVFS
jgi:hypothetical protein